MLRDTNCVQNWSFLSGKISQFHAIPDLFTASLHNSPLEGHGPSAPTFCLSCLPWVQALSASRATYQIVQDSIDKVPMQTGSLWTPKTCRFLVPGSSQSSILPGLSRNAALKPNCFGITVNPETHALDPLLWRVASCKLGSRWSRHIKTIQWDHQACPQRQQAPTESPHPTSTTSSNCLWGWALIVWLLILVELDCRWDSKISVFLCTFSIWESRSCSPSRDVRCVEIRSISVMKKSAPPEERSSRASISRKTWQVFAKPSKRTYDFEGPGRRQLRLLQFSHLFGYLTHGTNFDLMSRSRSDSQSIERSKSPVQSQCSSYIFLIRTRLILS